MKKKVKRKPNTKKKKNKMHEEATTTTTSTSQSVNKLNNSSLINISNATTNITVAIVSTTPQLGGHPHSHHHLHHQQHQAILTSPHIVEMHPSPSSSTQLAPIHTIQSGQHVAILPSGLNQTVSKIIINNNSIQTSPLPTSQSPSNSPHNNNVLETTFCNKSKALIPNNIPTTTTITNLNNNNCTNNKANVIVSTNQIPIVEQPSTTTISTTTQQYQTTQLIIATTVPANDSQHHHTQHHLLTGVITQSPHDDNNDGGGGGNICEVTTLQNVVPSITTTTTDSVPESSASIVLATSNSNIETDMDGNVVIRGNGENIGMDGTHGENDQDDDMEFDIQDLNNCSTDGTTEGKYVIFFFMIFIFFLKVKGSVIKKCRSKLSLMVVFYWKLYELGTLKTV